MTLKDKIKEALMKDRRISEASKYDPELQPNLYELSNFLSKSKYRLVDVVDHGETKIPEVIIEPINPGYLYPEIHHDIDEREFYIKVVEHGMLVDSDVEGIIQGYTNALAVLEYLKSIDLDSLEIVNEE